MTNERYFEASMDGVVNLPDLPRDRRWQYLRQQVVSGKAFLVFREVSSGEPPPDFSIEIGTVA